MNGSDNDLAAIRNLFSKYCFALDGSDPGLLLECFAGDGVLQAAGREFRGAGQLAAMARNGADRPRHHYSNLWFRRREGDRATASAYFFLLDLADGSCAGYGSYDDDLVRDVTQVWRFQRRRVMFLWQSDKYKARTTAITKQ